MTKLPDYGRLRTIQALAGALARLEELGASDMGHLSHREAARVHCTTAKLRRLVDDLVRTIPAPPMAL